MIKTLLFSALAAFMMMTAPVMAATVGEPAPAFTATDSDGKTHSLSDFKGKTVVLEWTNDQCPFVRKHYDSGNMQKLQEEYTGKGVVWLIVNSSAEGKQGHVTGEEANSIRKEEKSHATAYLLDANGEIGKSYDAKTTPHMYVIDQNGILVYNGAIDDNDSFNKEDAATAKNHVKAALDALAKGEEIEVAETKPYGCAVKY